MVREGTQLRDADREQDGPVARRSVVLSWRRRLPNMAMILTVLVLAVFLMQLSDQAAVRPMTSNDGRLFLRNQNVYAAAAQELFSAPINRNKLTVDTSKISADLRGRFPELQAVSVSLPIIGNKPTVYIQPATPKFILVSDQGMFVLDGNGRALISGNQVARLQELEAPIVQDQSNVPLQTGDIALPRNTVAFISTVVAQLRTKGIKTTTLVLPAGTNELHTRIEGAGYAVKFNLHGNAREEVGTYLAVKQRLQTERKAAREYIDVRVEGRAYYK